MLKPIWQDEKARSRLFKTGFNAKKYNYHNFSKKQVRITLDDKLTCLTYTTDQPPQNCMDKLKNKSTTIPLTNFVEILYGGQSVTFWKHVRVAMDAED